MPTYEYACRSCSEHFEVVQSFRDDALTDCPSCSGQLRKVFSAAGIIFKGSGWHVKDYASSKQSEGSSKDEADTSGTESSSGKDSGDGSDSGTDKSKDASGSSSSSESSGSSSGGSSAGGTSDATSSSAAEKKSA